MANDKAMMAKDGNGSKTAVAPFAATGKFRLEDFKKQVGDKFQALGEEGFQMTKFVQLEKDDVVRGRFLGRGGDTKVRNLNSKELEPMQTWQIEVSSNCVVTILGTSQLDSRLGGIPIGSQIVIHHLGQIKGGQGKVNDYDIYFKRGDDVDAKTPQQIADEAAASEAQGSA